ncbi:hypothetical protein [Piscinibacter gummiphilus]|uniref:hypothetical protein n=1 Tax=Piscinibacter gummiphilus TaxID=946333 RepID=UPI0012F4875B|nr:hypothetical protein [Piscinibacter gummiphilus]GLS97882.1 hypothetical protein GCM10007918_51740 [Piscinibacter gummiphilus]
MEWLDPWGSTEGEESSYLHTFAEQLERETRRGHELHGVKVLLIGRGDGDDALFEMLDGTGRVAEVHLVWQGRQKPPWPASSIYSSLEEWRVKRMIPQHKEWQGEE